MRGIGRGMAHKMGRGNGRGMRRGFGRDECFAEGKRVGGRFAPQSEEIFSRGLKDGKGIGGGRADKRELSAQE